MRRIKVRVHEGRVVEPAELPDEAEGWLTVPGATAATEGQHILTETNRAYATLKADRKAWDEERTERTLWDGTLADGLEAQDRDS
jgi:acyl dehydratase